MAVSYPHRIRLRGPWECEPLGAFVERPDGQVEVSESTVPGRFRMTMPCHWHEGGLENFRGLVRFHRRFGYPGQIDEDERVWLTFVGWTGTGNVSVNGQSLIEEHEGAPCAFDITSLLRPNNELLVEIESVSPQAGLWGEVALEIRATAYLDAVSFRLSEGPTLEVTGKVVGTSPRPLDLDVVINNQAVDHTTVVPSEEGTDFQFTKGLSLPDGASTLLGQVELIDGGTTWFVVEHLIDLAE
ncbi:MAG: hypothetical protein ACFCD0_02915 [Gemmataceae bacterium]